MSGFVDECNLHVTAGDGGSGCVAFRREAHVSRGGPCGGDGGRGGDIWLVADRNTASLLAFRDHPHRRADNGAHGLGSSRHGARGCDLDIVVPVGTEVLDHGSRAFLADLASHGDRWQAARGGVGGRGNSRFLSNTRRAPEFAEQGEQGERRWLRLELKLLADVAIVGFPNAGKSTFISRVSSAKPKIAGYPFTTLEPNLGVVRIDDFTDLVLADIPGLISGASEGKGLGHRFLRHIERSRVLLVMLDLSPWALAEPLRQLEVLLSELGCYRPELLERPRVVVASRADMADMADDACTVDLAGMVDSACAGMAGAADRSDAPHVSRLSSVTGEGVGGVIAELARLVDEARCAEPVKPSVVVHRPLGAEVSVGRADDGSWLVSGRAAERAVALKDMTHPDALAYSRKRLERLGVERSLVRAGVASGDTVRIGDFEFEYRADDDAALLMP